jgi:lambda family phage tail tape measure protein
LCPPHKGDVMADIKIDMVLADGGSINKKTGETKALNSELTKTQKLSSRALAGESGTMSGQKVAEYGRSRATVGTGAEARDFAKQSEGLSGLVRLYAVYAANLYAAGAAFTALSQAMDTSNMIRAMNQLGSVSGIALGSLAQRFVETADGAISLREAMEAVTKSTAAGLSGKQLLQISEIAKKASQSLGVAMPDAISRLTRGIVKLEPELLDELGLFTKIGPATEEYARKIGKTTSALTDFERRQAFANAVITEGIDKFSAVDIPANPYTKLLATLKDLSQTALSLVNTVLTPLVNVLNSNPTALALLIAGIGASIIRSAIPALGSYKEALRDMTAETQKQTRRRAEIAQRALEVQRGITSKEILAEKDKVAAIRDLQLDAAEGALKQVSKKGLPKDVRQILRKDVLSIDDKDLAKLTALGRGNDQVALSYQKLTQAIISAKQANQQYFDTSSRLSAAEKAPAPRGSAAWFLAQEAEAGRQKGARFGRISDTVETTQTKGMGAAFSELSQGIKEDKLGKFNTAVTGVVGAISILGTKIVQVGGFLLRFLLGPIGLAIAAYQTLDMLFSTNTQQLDAFNGAMDNSAKVVDNATEVQKKYGSSLTVESLQAKTRSLTDLSDAVGELSKKFAEVEQNSSWFDKATNWVKGLFGYGIADKFAESLSKSTMASIGNIFSDDLAKSTKQKIADAIGIDGDLTQKKLEDGLKKVKDRTVADKIKKIIDEANKEQQEIARPIFNLQENLTNLEKSYQDLNNTFNITDPLAKFAVQSIGAANSILESLQDVNTAAATLQKLSENSSKLKLFGPEVQQNIQEAAGLVASMTAEMQKQQQIQQTLAIALNNPNLQQGDRQNLQGQYNQVSSLISSFQTNIRSIISNIGTSLGRTIVDGAKVLNRGIDTALKQGAIGLNKSILDSLPKTPEIIRESIKLELQSIDLRKQELSETKRLIDSIEKNTISTNLRTAETDLKTLTSMTGPLTSEQEKEKDKLTTLVTNLQQQLTAYTNPRSLRGVQVTQETANILGRQGTYNRQMQELTNQQGGTIIKGFIDVFNSTTEQLRKEAESAIRLQEERNRQYFNSAEFAQMNLEQQGFERLKREQEVERGRSRLETLGLERQQKLPDYLREEIRKTPAEKGRPTISQSAISIGMGAAESAAQTAKSEQEALEAIQKLRLQNTETERTKQILSEADLRVLENTKQVADSIFRINTEDLASSRQQIDIDTQNLETRRQLGLLTEQEYNAQQRLLQARTRDQDLEEQKLNIRKQRLEELLEIDKKLADPKVTGEEKTRLEDSRRAAESYYDRLIQRETDLYNSKQKNDQMLKQFSDRQLAYSKIFENAFDSMADAIVQFAQTGKLNFKDLINSMLADLLRYELRLQMSAMYKGLRPGLMNLVGSLFNTPAAPGMSLPPLEFAMGGAFDGGIKKYAKGGTFTNSIVDSPTMFKFAKGTGLMGEAGPEAIMPLKRDSQGNLGVRGGGGNVEVVVNNYSSEKAEARETQDSRGNRRIEVVVGDMTAGEVTRGGSSTNRAIRSTFGMNPQLIRR